LISFGPNFRIYATLAWTQSLQNLAPLDTASLGSLDILNDYLIKRNVLIIMPIKLIIQMIGPNITPLKDNVNINAVLPSINTYII